eukprot:scaffold2846_cov322-Pavlova_lutheri.AAC.23
MIRGCEKINEDLEQGEACEAKRQGGHWVVCECSRPRYDRLIAYEAACKGIRGTPRSCFGGQGPTFGTTVSAWTWCFRRVEGSERKRPRPLLPRRVPLCYGENHVRMVDEKADCAWAIFDG